MDELAESFFLSFAEKKKLKNSRAEFMIIGSNVTVTDFSCTALRSLY